MSIFIQPHFSQLNRHVALVPYQNSNRKSTVKVTAVLVINYINPAHTTLQTATPKQTKKKKNTHSSNTYSEYTRHKRTYLGVVLQKDVRQC